MTETWKILPGWGGLYEISDLGRVRSLHRNSRSGDALRQFVVSKYLAVNLSANGTRATKHVHRLVIEAFIGPIPKGMHASHLDGDRYNNRLSNLVIETPSMNCSRRKGHGTQAYTKPNAKINDAIAADIRAMYTKGHLQREIAEAFGVTQSNISKILSGLTW